MNSDTYAEIPDEERERMENELDAAGNPPTDSQVARHYRNIVILLTYQLEQKTEEERNVSENLEECREGIEEIIKDHEMYCEHHVGVSQHSYDIIARLRSLTENNKELEEK